MIRSKLLIAAAIVVSGVLTACSDTATDPKSWTVGPSQVVTRSGAFRVITECSQYTGLANSFCTITSSNLTEIGVGSTMVYGSAASATSLHSDVILDPPAEANNAAFGHCDFDLVTDRGQCTFTNGTGDFAGFQASAVGTYVGGNIWYWDGTYKFVASN